MPIAFAKRLGAAVLLAAASLAHAQIVYVDPDSPGPQDGISWSRAYHDLAAALTATASNPAVTEIRVAEGLYRPAGTPADRTATFRLRSGLALRGSFAGFGAPNPNVRRIGVTVSVLNGDLDGNDADWPFSDCCYDRLNESNCDQDDCAAAVCAVDPDCCSASGTFPDTWWGDCVTLAESLCGDLCLFNDDNAYHVVTAQNVDATAVLDGFFIEAGYAQGSTYFDTVGGGLTIRNASPTIQSCTFRRNSGGYGAAVFLIDASSATRFINCRFEHNYGESWAGAVYARRSSPRFDDCWFDSNFAAINGGAVNFDEQSSTDFHQCFFIANRTGPTGNGGAMLNGSDSRTDVLETYFLRNESQYGGAVANYPDGNNGGRFVQCSFVANRASESGGAVDNWGETDFVNCAFVLNEARHGGAVYHGTASAPYILRLVQCTVFGNQATLTAGGLYHGSTLGLHLYNSILWGNTAGPGQTLQAAQLQITSAAPIVRYCAVEGWTGTLGGTGNSGADPLFRDPIGLDEWPNSGDEDLRLHPDSPYIDAGSNGLIPADTLDLDGDGDTAEPLPWDANDLARVRDGDDDGEARVDLGVFEYPATPPGDVDHDDDIDLADFRLFGWYMQGPRVPLIGDFDDSRFVGLRDYDAWVDCFGGPGLTAGEECTPMDLDGDADIDLQDYAQWSDHYGDRWFYSSLVEPLDMDQDFDVDLKDFALWTLAWQNQ